MRIELVQFAPKFPGREENWERIREWSRRSPADIVVFPELSSCGYMYEKPEEIRPYVDAPSALGELERISAATGKLIVGGFAEQAAGARYNSAYAVGPQGTSIYRKIHLWNREKLLFREGGRPCMVEFQGRRIGIEVCYDIQFPELSAYLSRQGAELILAPTAWAVDAHGPSHGLHPHAFLAMATAYAYGIFVAVTNRTGPERGAVFPGQSCLADPWGQITILGESEEHRVFEIPFEEVPLAKRPNPRNDLQTDPRMVIAPPGGTHGSRQRRSATQRPTRRSSRTRARR
ncbi:MAG TPA: carbon-nitrogen hydrolase family protein [Thermoplasmata archaeon]|nr:carbon-nitrogen hydrolase family protein [Thermoplasmata archaeon]